VDAILPLIPGRAFLWKITYLCISNFRVRSFLFRNPKQVFQLALARICLWLQIHWKKKNTSKAQLYSNLCLC